MPTNDERREVAARLRRLSGHREVDKEFVHEALGLYMGECVDGYDPVSVSELADLIEPEPIDGDTSDGYHTFNELYDHRAKLFSVVVAAFSNIAWKSKRHSDGSMYEGMFIVGIDTPHGQATYHYEIEPYWELFRCSELPKAPEFDGHTPTQAIDRIASLADLIEPEERTCRNLGAYGGFECSICGFKERQLSEMECEPHDWFFCPNCGAKVVDEDA